MLFLFPPAIQDAVTGQFVKHAVGVANQPLLAIPNLFLDVPNLLLGAAQMVQTDRGFQKTYKMLDTLQNTVGVLQATTAVIGVGTVAGVALSAVNLRQTLKLREDVEQMRIEVRNGFIDLKQALKGQGKEVIQRIDQVAQDVEFRHHRTILVQAYGSFVQALVCLRDALKLPDTSLRNAGISSAQNMLYAALANYDNPMLIGETCSAGQLRRKECAWAIDQAITTTYQLMGAHEVVSARLSSLQQKIRQDTLTVIDSCESENELDFLFPELTRIHNQDLAVLESWQNHADWIETLAPDERQMLASSDMTVTDSPDIEPSSTVPVELAEQSVGTVELAEQSVYEDLKQKSHYLSLRDQLRFVVKPDLRHEHESYISQQATAQNCKALAPSNWQEVPDLTVANLYWYFKTMAQS